MKQNRFKTVLREGRIPVGHMIMEFGTRGIAKLIESADVDFVVIDMEHNGFGSERVADLMAWFKATDIAPFVRVPQALYHFLARTMDVGALGVMVGNVETADQARAIVSAVKYAPLGNRGVGLGTAHNDYIPPDPVAYMREANENTTVICQIESRTGLANLNAIAGTEGVDALWVGHFDLSQSMGIPGQFEDPHFVEALSSVVNAAETHRKASAIQPGTMEQAERWLALGFRVLSWKTDIALYRGALQREIRALRDRISNTGASTGRAAAPAGSPAADPVTRPHVRK
jgi:2-dehydro-3-deoxyglucarate aldolase/4-hydroxy-2-oxoheptanedioate aldolase